jgi:MFS transporter, DHA1 family, multidrug resistance protein
MTATNPPPLLNSNLRWFLLAMILANIAGQMAYSMLSLYLVDLGASVGQVGLVFTVASLVPMLLQILGGWISDTIGRLRAIAFGSSIAVFGYLLFFLSPSWQWVMVGLCIEYVSNSFVGPSFGAYIAEQTAEEQRGRVYGLSSSLYMTVTVIGPALAGILAYKFGFRWMLLVAFVIYLLATCVRISMALMVRFAPLKSPQKPTFAGLKLNLVAMFGLLLAGGVLTWIWITDAINDTSFNMIGQLYPIYLSEVGKLNVAQIGFVNSAWGVASILAGFLAGWLVDKRSERAVIAGAFLIEGISLFLLLQVTTYVGFMAAMFVFGFGVGCLIPAYNSLISKVVPEDRRGLAFGFFGTSLGFLSLPFPWIGAQLWEHYSPQLPFFIAGVALLVSVPIAWFKFKLPGRQEKPV